MKRAYPYQTAPEALRALHKEIGTWREVGEYLSEHGDGKFYASLIYRAQEGVGIERVRMALEGASLIPPRRRRDGRKTRAWHGTPERADELDSRLWDLGFRNVQHFIDDVVLGGIWISLEEKEELSGKGYQFGAGASRADEDGAEVGG